MHAGRVVNLGKLVCEHSANRLKYSCPVFALVGLFYDTFFWGYGYFNAIIAKVFCCECACPADLAVQFLHHRIGGRGGDKTEGVLLQGKTCLGEDGRAPHLSSDIGIACLPDDDLVEAVNLILCKPAPVILQLIGGNPRVFQNGVNVYPRRPSENSIAGKQPLWK